MKRRLLIALSIIPLATLLGGTWLVLQIKQQQGISSHVQVELVEIIRLTETFVGSLESIRAELAEAEREDSLERLVSSVEYADEVLALLSDAPDVRAQRGEMLGDAAQERPRPLRERPLERPAQRRGARRRPEPHHAMKSILHDLYMIFIILHNVTLIASFNV